MNTLTPQSLKKLLYSLGLSLLLIFIFLIFKFFYFQEKEIQPHSFRKSSPIQKEEISISKTAEEKEAKFLLLPSTETSH